MKITEASRARAKKAARIAKGKKKEVATRGSRKIKGNEDTRSRRKYKKGGRIEAYTFGEAQRSKDWPFG